MNGEGEAALLLLAILFVACVCILVASALYWCYQQVRLWWHMRKRWRAFVQRPPVGIVPALSEEEKASMRVYWLANQHKLVNEHMEE